MFSIPLPLLLDDIRKLAERNYVLRLKFASHQDFVRRARQMQTHFCIESFDCLGSIGFTCFFRRIGIGILLGDAQRLSVFVGAGGEMRFVNNQQINRIGKNLLVARLDGITLEVLERCEQHNPMPRIQFFGNSRVLGLKVFSAEEHIRVFEIVESQDRILPFARHISLAGNDDNELRLHFQCTFKSGYRLPEPHDGIHEEIGATFVNSFLESIYCILLIGAQYQIHRFLPRLVILIFANGFYAVERIFPSGFAMIFLNVF